jgi:uncharacterized spore protein YtfJ
MEVSNLLQSLGERLQTGASVKNVFGDPVTLADRVVIPVARVAYGFGGGGGSHIKGSAPEQEGAGGGAGLAAEPMGIVEISAAGTRYLAFPKYRNTGIALALGVALGFLAGTRAARRKR